MALIKSFRGALTFTNLLIALLPLAVTGLLSLQILNANMEREIRDKNLLLSRSIGSEFNTFLDESMDFLRLIEDLLDNRQIIGRDETDALLRSMIDINGNFDMINILDSRGEILNLAPSDESMRGMNLSYMDNYRETERSGEPSWSRTYISPQSGSPTINLSLPMKKGMIIGYINLDTLSLIVSRRIVSAGGFAAATDSDGTVIAHPDRLMVQERVRLNSQLPVAEGLAGKSGSYLYRQGEEEYLGSVTPLEKTGWVILVSQPVGEVFRPVRTIRLLWILLFLLAFGLGELLTLINLKRILSPLSMLGTDARFAAGGDYSRGFHLSSYSEINELIETFQVLIDSVNQREKELKSLQNYLYDIINSMPSVLICVDEEMKVILHNGRAEESGGARNLDELEDLIGESIKSRAVRELRKRQRDSEKGKIVEYITIYPLTSGDRSGAVIRIDDVTDKSRMEELLIQSEKMLSIGGLAAGMAHEINNPLAGITQTANVLKKRLMGDRDIPANRKAFEEIGLEPELLQSYMDRREIPRMLDSMIDSGKRIAGIVSNMLDFSRKSDSRKSTVSLEQLMEKTIEIAGTDYDLKKEQDFRNIAIVREYEKDMKPVVCESGKLQQVFLNLLRNGAQAMQGHTKEPQFTVRIHSDENDLNAVVEIEDNGPGMDEETKKRIFEPFFTTKAPGLGTGLGLSVSYFIISEEHRGTLSVRSSPGQGTLFIITLPY